MKQQRWTAEECEALKQRYPLEITTELAASIGRTKTSTHKKARELGLKKDKSLLSQIGHRYAASNGKATQFRHNNQPWNKGLKGYNAGGKSLTTRFKPGNRPHTYLPIGTEVMDSRGYMKRKIADTTPASKGWKPAHVIIWEQHNGPLSDGHFIIFLDHDKTNIDIHNLACVNRKIHMRLTKRGDHSLPPELKQTAIALAKVEIAKNNRLAPKQKQDDTTQL